MFILLHGADNFQSLKKLHELKRTFVEQKKGDIITLEPVEFTLTLFNHHLKSLGLFNTQKLIILKNCIEEKKIANMQEFKNIAQRAPSDTTIIMYERVAFDQKNQSFKMLLPLATHEGKLLYPAFKLLDAVQKNNYIKKSLADGNKTITPYARTYLVRAIKDTWQMESEIHKLLMHESQTIDRGVVETLVAPSFDDNIFTFIDTISASSQSVFELLHRHLENGAEPLYLLAMITRQVKILLKLHSAAYELRTTSPKVLAEAVQEHPFVVQKSLPLLAKFPQDHLVHLYKKLLITDERLKSTRISPHTLLALIIYDMIRV